VPFRASPAGRSGRNGVAPEGNCLPVGKADGLLGKYNSAIVGWTAITHPSAIREQLRHMPSLFRFLTIAGLLGAIVLGGLLVTALLLEPGQREMSTSVPGIKIRR
jgi:hypothetical protein